MTTEIEELENCVNEQNIQELDIKKQELENLRKEKIKGKIVRSRVKWVEEGEKPTKYFCGLESKNFVSKIIPKVEKDDGQIVKSQTDILKEIQNFYKSLYEKKNQEYGGNIIDLDRELKNLNFQKLSSEEKLSLEGEITVSEASQTLSKMKNNKTPGSDGFSTEYFKFFGEI